MHKRVFILDTGLPPDSVFNAQMHALNIATIDWGALKGVTDDLGFGYEVVGCATGSDIELLEWTAKAGGFLVVPPNSAAHDWCLKSSWDMWLVTEKLSPILANQKFASRYAGG